MTKKNQNQSHFAKLFETREEPAAPELEVSQTPTSEVVIPLPQAQPQTQPRKRGRPTTGKRSNDAWIGRTFYVQRENDLDVEDELLKLKRQDIEIDKSELVDALLGAWVKWRQGENIEIHLNEITPRRNS